MDHRVAAQVLFSSVDWGVMALPMGTPRCSFHKGTKGLLSPRKQGNAYQEIPSATPASISYALGASVEARVLLGLVLITRLVSILSLSQRPSNAR